MVGLMELAEVVVVLDSQEIMLLPQAKVVMVVMDY